MKFSTNIIRSFVDLPNYLSMMVYSIGCNFNCYQCFAYNSLVANPIDVCEDNYIINQIKLNSNLYDAIIFSGGEFLNNNIDDIIVFLIQVRKIFKGIIIVNTNGSHPNKMKILNDQNLVDGFHTDMKLPWYAVDITNIEDQKIIKDITGININQSIINDISSSINYTIQFDKGYSQIRSVKYPQLDELTFDMNKDYINKLNNKYNKKTKYYTNIFIKEE